MHLPPDPWDPIVHARLTALLDRPVDPAAPPVAVFDFDDTVLRGDISLFMLRAHDALHGTTWHDDYHRLLAEGGRALAYPQIALWFAGRSVAEVSAWWATVVDEAFERGVVAVRPGVRDLIAAAAARGWRLHVVTASPGALVRHAAPRAGLDPERVHGMDLAEGADGAWADHLAGPPTFCEGKAEVVRTRIAARPTLVAGDSRSDADMMDLAEHALLVDGHDAVLRREARAKGWMIQSGWHHSPAEPGVIRDDAPEASP